MKKPIPECELCGKRMTKIIVDFEGDGSVMTAYECPEHQPFADLESIEELQGQGVPVLRFMEEVAALPDGTPYLPIAKQIATLAKLQPGKKVQVTMTDGEYIMVKVA